MYRRSAYQNSSNMQKITSALAANRVTSANSSSQNEQEALSTQGGTTVMSRGRAQRVLSGYGRPRPRRQHGVNSFGNTFGSSFFQKHVSMLSYNPTATKCRNRQQCSLGSRKDETFQYSDNTGTLQEEEKYPLPTDKERMFLISSGG